jgi:hypothetical protein
MKLDLAETEKHEGTFTGASDSESKMKAASANDALGCGPHRVRIPFRIIA